MDKMDLYYSAFQNYRKITEKNKICQKPRSKIARTDIENDKIDVLITECEIFDDWIDEIENGLVFIDKAIKEERQFILSNGEVIPVEKVRSVSKESVEHLAKHSDLITRVPEDNDDIIPEKLYTVERLTDYAVYENRFLYMLLCYLRDFISIRYNKIVEAITTYHGKITLRKSVSFGDRKSEILIALDEKIFNDTYLWAHSPVLDKVHRIDVLLKAVLNYLSHPLMEIVAKAPMLKPPITETNVLKMNKNFHGAMQLYYFITAYDKEGYVLSESKKEVAPFTDSVGDEIAEIVELISFMTYKHGMGIEEDLENAYQQRLEEEKKAAEKQLLDDIAKLKQEIQKNGGDPIKYMVFLEKRNDQLEQDSRELNRAKAKILEQSGIINSLNETIEMLKDSVATLRQEVVDKQNEIDELNRLHEEQIRVLQEQHEREMASLKEEYTIEIENLNKAHQEEIDRLNKEQDYAIAMMVQKHKEEIESLNLKHAQDVENLNNKHTNEIAMLNVTLSKSVARENALQTQYDNKNAEYEQLSHEKYLISAKLNALKSKSGLYDGNEDYNSREGFEEIEREYNEFKQFFNEQWKLTKKKIRKQYLKADLQKKGEDKNNDTTNVENIVEDKTDLKETAKQEMASVQDDATKNVKESKRIGVDTPQNSGDSLQK